MKEEQWKARFVYPSRKCGSGEWQRAAGSVLQELLSGALPEHPVPAPAVPGNHLELLMQGEKLPQYPLGKCLKICKEQGEQAPSHGEAEKEVKVFKDSSKNKIQYVSFYTDVLIQVLCFICCCCFKPKIRLRAVVCAGEHF